MRNSEDFLRLLLLRLQRILSDGNQGWRRRHIRPRRDSYRRNIATRRASSWNSDISGHGRQNSSCPVKLLSIGRPSGGKGWDQGSGFCACIFDGQILDHLEETPVIVSAHPGVFSIPSSFPGDSPQRNRSQRYRSSKKRSSCNRS